MNATGKGLMVAVWLIVGGAALAQTSQSAAPSSARGRDDPLKQGAATFDASGPVELEVKKARTGHLLVRPRINGREAGWFIFDTGAGCAWWKAPSSTS